MILSIAAVVFTFGLVIFLHELGHFIGCRISGMKVEAFSLGFGPELFGRTRGNTRYSIRAIPLGGYVKPAGELMEEASGAPDEYFSKPWYARLGVCLAGPAMNYILAFFLFTGVVISVGEPVPSDNPVIGEISEGFPAQNAGIKAGDTILSINGTNTAKWSDITDIIHSNPEKELTIVYSRDNNKTTVKLTAKKGQVGDKTLGLVGISPVIDYKPISFFSAVSNGAYQCWYWTKLTVTTLASNIKKREKPDLAGPIGIVNVVSKAAHSGFSDFIYLIGLISVAIGFFNLLPIPLVDGGQSLLFILEGITRKKPTLQIMGYINTAGLAFLLFIFIFASYNDVMRLKASYDAKKTGQTATTTTEQPAANSNTEAK